MDYIAVFDIGTTAIKGLLLDREGGIVHERSFPVQTFNGEKNRQEQNPEEWWQGVVNISREWFDINKINPESVKAITFSGQMEDVILIKGGEKTTKAILYSDHRAGKEAEIVRQQFPDFHHVTGNSVYASTPVAKLVWLKTHALPAEKVHVVFSAKDYIIYKMTGAILTDHVTAATTGLMNIETRKWQTEFMGVLGLNEVFHLPKLASPGQVAGKMNEAGAGQTGFRRGTPVLCGAGDAGASTLGAGAINEGDCYLYIGTTGWMAIPTKDGSPKENGIFTLAHAVHDLNIAIAPVLNAGNVHSWAMESLAGIEDFALFDKEVQKSPPGANSLFFLPYLNGERCPIQDSDAKGAFWGIGPRTTKADFARAVLEGICYSLKQITELLAGHGGTMTLIGGGAKSPVWCQLLADMTSRPVRVPEHTEYLPSLGMGATAFAYLGWVKDESEFVRLHIESAPAKTYVPDEGNVRFYQKQYQTYVKLYPAMEKIYH
ncbi:xylulokinase [Mesobacillus foraminis]|uniref:xylulokinase n=1 Tax=Mesobacillus foraminis TaxID=279826 RepID=UPI0013CEE786|nr:FGGY family carbohydrate kinase [Mesobacillus foraminis]